MTRPDAAKVVLTVLVFGALAVAEQACVVSSVAGAAVGVTTTAVNATTKVAGTAVGLGADAVGAAGKTVTGGKR
jgi:hypothetical protein